MTTKEIFENKDIIIRQILQGFNGRIRIDAANRSYQADKENLFSNWCNKKYADSLAREHYGYTTNKFKCYRS